MNRDLILENCLSPDPPSAWKSIPPHFTSLTALSGKCGLPLPFHVRSSDSFFWISAPTAPGIGRPFQLCAKLKIEAALLSHGIRAIVTSRAKRPD
jgi:hypothetical protein